MAKKQKTFASKLKKENKSNVPLDPETGEPLQFVRFVKFKKSPQTGNYKISDSLVAVGKKNHKEIWG